MGRRLECNFFYPLSGSETFKVLYLVQQTAIIFEKKHQASNSGKGHKIAFFCWKTEWNYLLP